MTGSPLVDSLIFGRGSPTPNVPFASDLCLPGMWVRMTTIQLCIQFNCVKDHPPPPPACHPVGERCSPRGLVSAEVTKVQWALRSLEYSWGKEVLGTP